MKEILSHFLPQRAVERETAGSVGLFFSLVSAIERSQAELIEVLEMSRRAAAHQADAMIRQLELEVEELRRRGCALAELAQSDDHNHCVKVSEDLDVQLRDPDRLDHLTPLFSCFLFIPTCCARCSPSCPALHRPETGQECP